MVLEKKRNQAVIIINAYCRGWKVNMKIMLLESLLLSSVVQ